MKKNIFLIACLMFCFSVTNYAQLGFIKDAGKGVLNQTKKAGKFVKGKVTSSDKDYEYQLPQSGREYYGTNETIFKATDLFSIQQKSNGRYMDAYDYPGTDYAVVSRTNQSNNTQRWIFMRVGYNTYTIQQKSTGRYLDAYDYDGTDFKAVLRPYQGNDTQKWVIVGESPNSYTIMQKSTGRYLDAHEYSEKDFGLVTRPAQLNTTQEWIISKKN
jgi:hypothetical protein